MIIGQKPGKKQKTSKIAPIKDDNWTKSREKIKNIQNHAAKR